MADLLQELQLPLTLCFGTRTLRMDEVLELTLGDVFSLDRELNEPVDILAGGRVVAKAEVVAVDGNYAVRVVSTSSSEVQ